MDKNILKAYFDTNSYKNETIITNVINILNKNGCNVIQSVIGTDFQYSESSRKSIKNIYKNKTYEINSSDIAVFEMSAPSIFLFNLIYEALNQRKPTLLLIPKNVSSSMDLQFEKNYNSMLFTNVYDENSLEMILKDYINTANRKVLKNRYSLRLSEEHSDILDFLKYKWNCTSKNEVIIRLLENEGGV